MWRPWTRLLGEEQGWALGQTAVCLSLSPCRSHPIFVLSLVLLYFHVVAHTSEYSVMAYSLLFSLILVLPPADALCQGDKAEPVWGTGQN